MSNPTPLETLRVYVVRNAAGDLSHRRSEGRYSACFTSDPTEAKLYRKIKNARAQCTWLANTYPEHGVPDLIEILPTDWRVLDEANRVSKATEAKRRELEKWEAERAAAEARKDADFLAFQAFLRAQEAREEERFKEFQKALRRQEAEKARV